MAGPSSLACLLLLLSLILNPVSVLGDLSSDAAALLAFKGNLSHFGSKLSTWNAASVPGVCNGSWDGINCSGSGSSQRIIGVSLPGRSLIGKIASGTLGRLDALEKLSLRNNGLNGSLPADVANWTSLIVLNLSTNSFSGDLPSNFSPWHLLKTIDVSGNRFSGPIPASLGNLTNLRYLYLQNNSFSGSIPSIANLIGFNVSYNQLNGTIPATLANFSADAFGGDSLCGKPLDPCSSVLVSQSKKKKLSPGAIAGIIIGGLAFLLLLLLCCCLLCRKRTKDKQRDRDFFVAGRSQFQQGQEAKDTKRPVDAMKEDKNRLVFIDTSRNTFELEELLRASAEVLGKGSLGTTYKAVLEDGVVLAVKRLRDVAADREAFVQRIETVGRLDHENLVPLRAYYFAKEEKLIVYDHMPNGSLSSVLHGTTGVGRTPLDWDTRLRIALGAARGIAYLHSHQLVHGDLKSPNVLLNSRNDGCLADSGLVELVTFTPGSNKTLGYAAPEITDTKKVTEKGDVYSFGILLLELLTGKAPTQAAMSEDGVDLPRWAQSVAREGWTADVFDAELTKYQSVQDEMMQLFQIALPCISPSPDQRPRIGDVVKMIENLKKNDSDIVYEEPFNPYPQSKSENV